MFATGLKIVRRNNTFYVITKDLLLSPEKETVQVFEDGDFVDMPRVRIFADIAAGAYVTTVKYRVVSKELLINAINCAAHDLFSKWYGIYKEETEPCWKQLVFDNYVDEMLRKAAETLMADGYDVNNFTLKICDCWYPVEELLLISAKKAYRHFVGGEKFVF